MGFINTERALREFLSLSKSPLSAELDAIATEALASASQEDALGGVTAITENISEKTIEDFLKDKKNLHYLITLCACSPYLSRILTHKPEWFEWLFLEDGLVEIKDQIAFTKELSDWCSAASNFDETALVLRSYRNREFLRLGLRDLLHLGSMQETTRGLSDLAGACLDVALEFCLSELIAKHGVPTYTKDTEKTAEFTIIALGKLGGGELNFCSDIDLLYIYTTEKGETKGIANNKRSVIDLHTFFQRLGRLITKMISAVTAEGFVFRVDLDLRPEGRSGELVNSLHSAEVYYESWGRTWERSAMIKARPVAGSRKLGEDFLKMIEPFVYRRSLDFSTLEEIKMMKERIDISLLRRDPDAIDVKLGKGGIREIEFFCQALQLIYGGKITEIKELSTMTSIDKLVAKELLKEGEAETLKKGYIFLRDLEHRIQIVEGRQSQAIPQGSAEVERLSLMMGFKADKGKSATEVFWQSYRRITSEVSEVYRTLFYQAQDELEKDISKEILLLFSPLEEEGLPEDIAKILEGLGFSPTIDNLKKIKLLRDGPAYLRVSSATRTLREKIAPYLAERASGAPDPDMALANTERFLSTLGARRNLFALLAENPKLTSLLVHVFGSSLYLANSLITRPENLEILLSSELSTPLKENFVDELSELLSRAKDYEEKLDILRRYKNQEFFRIGFNDLQGRLSTREVSAQISKLAEAILQTGLDIALAELRPKYGEPSNPSFFIIGMGKLGGKELIYGSDLDIFFAYIDDKKTDKTETSGPKVITDHEFFVRLAQRIISIISVKTSEGSAFEIDTRLRPSGSAGPLTISSSALLDYHRDKAVAWERQAALKARVVAGNIESGALVIKQLREITAKRGLSTSEARELLKIRTRMEKEIAKETSGVINIKTGRGGLVDIEFLAQALLMRYAGQTTTEQTEKTGKSAQQLSARLSTQGMLERLSAAKVIKTEQYQVLSEAYEFYRTIETRLRIMQDNTDCRLYYKKISKSVNTKENDVAIEGTAALARRCSYSGKEAAALLVKEYKESSEQVRRLYLEIMEGLAKEPD
jgi:glutamate-ammonia-ligase adenylyltransferase